MKWFGKKAISGLTKVIRGKSGGCKGKASCEKRNSQCPQPWQSWE